MKTIALVFLVVGAVVRLLPHPSNVTPLTAMALLAGAQFRPLAAIGLAVGAMWLGDVALGWGVQNLMGYPALALTALVGARLQRMFSASGVWHRRCLTPNCTAVAVASLSGSTLFFLLSNFGVWLEGWLYPRTWEGLVTCYVAGLPFYRNQLLGDLGYTALFFGGVALMSRRLRPAPIPQRG